MATPWIVLIVIAFLLFDALVIFVVLKGRKPGPDQFAQLASELGLPLRGGDPVFPGISWLSALRQPTYVEGNYRGRPLKVRNFTKGSGKNRSPWHEVCLTLNNPRGLTFYVGPESLFSKIGKAIGMQDIPVGDPRFDETFVLKCNDQTFAQAGLFPEIRARMLEVVQRYHKFGAIHLKGERLAWEHHGHLRSEDERPRVVAVAAILADLADALEAYESMR